MLSFIIEVQGCIYFMAILNLICVGKHTYWGKCRITIDPWIFISYCCVLHMFIKQWTFLPERCKKTTSNYMSWWKSGRQKWTPLFVCEKFINWTSARQSLEMKKSGNDKSLNANLPKMWRLPILKTNNYWFTSRVIKDVWKNLTEFFIDNCCSWWNKLCRAVGAATAATAMAFQVFHVHYGCG